ncbi:MAG: hypothetical protein AB1744_05520 [Candidatus Zixiibacteriota bacterium]
MNREKRVFVGVFPWVVGAVVVLAIATGCKTQEASCQWADTPVVVDGKIEDWIGVSVTYFEDEEAVLGLCSNDTNLYIQVRFKNPRWASVIRMTGLTLWIDADGNEDKDVGLRFHAGPSPAELPPGSNEQRQRFLQGAMPADETFIFFDESYYVEALVPIDGARGPSAKYDTSLGFYSYEFSVPLQESGVQFYGLGVKPGQTISIGAMWGDMPDMQPDRGDMPGGPGGMSGGPGGMGGGPGGMGGRPGGMAGGPGGMGGGRGRQMQQPEKQEVWIKTQLALPPSATQSEQ